MNPFQSYTLEWWQIGLLKISMIAFGIAVGATWPGVFGGWLTLLWLVFVAGAVYMTFVGLKLSRPRERTA